jgi:kynureninase
MSIKLTDTQLVLLGAAAQRKDLFLLTPRSRAPQRRKSRVS